MSIFFVNHHQAPLSQTLSLPRPKSTAALSNSSFGKTPSALESLPVRDERLVRSLSLPKDRLEIAGVEARKKTGNGFLIPQMRKAFSSRTIPSWNSGPSLHQAADRPIISPAGNEHLVRSFSTPQDRLEVAAVEARKKTGNGFLIPKIRKAFSSRTIHSWNSGSSLNQAADLFSLSRHGSSSMASSANGSSSKLSAGSLSMPRKQAGSPLTNGEEQKTMRNGFMHPPHQSPKSRLGRLMKKIPIMKQLLKF